MHWKKIELTFFFQNAWSLEVAIIIVLAERGAGCEGGGGAATANDSKKALFSLLIPLPWHMDGFEDFPFRMPHYILLVGSSHARPSYQHAKRGAAPLPLPIAASLLHF